MAHFNSSSLMNAVQPTELPPYFFDTRVPMELLMIIGENVEKESDLNAFAQTCRRCYAAVQSRLLQMNIEGERQALHWACVHGKLEMVQLFIDAGASIYLFNYWVHLRKFSTPLGYYPLDRVRQMNRRDMLPQRFEPGVADSYSKAIQNLQAPLCIAVAWRHVEVVRLLVAEGIPPLHAPRCYSLIKYDNYDAIDWAMTMSPFCSDMDLFQEVDKVVEILKILFEEDQPAVRCEYLTYICDQWLDDKWRGNNAQTEYMLRIIKTFVVDLDTPVLFLPNTEPQRAHVKPKHITIRFQPMLDTVFTHVVHAKGEDLAWRLKLFEALLEGKADTELPRYCDTTFLYSAVANRNAPLIRVLLAKGVDPSAAFRLLNVTPSHVLSTEDIEGQLEELDIA